METLYSGRFLNMVREGRWEYCERVNQTGAVMIFALTPDDKVLLVEEFRPPIGKQSLCFPAGLSGDEGPESEQAAAHRELLEETGATAAHYRSLGTLYPTPGYCDEVIHLFLAQGLSFGESCPDEDEFVEVVRIPLDTAVQMVLNNEIPDAKTQVAVLKVAMFLK